MKIMSERSVRTLVRKVAEEESAPVPTIFFVDNQWSHAHDDGITLASPAWVGKHRAGGGREYRLLVLHEMAHWVTRREGHTARFYYELFLLCLTYGVKLSFAYDDEVKYKPRAARAGLEMLVA